MALKETCSLAAYTICRPTILTKLGTFGGFSKHGISNNAAIQHVLLLRVFVLFHD